MKTIAKYVPMLLLVALGGCGAPAPDDRPPSFKGSEEPTEPAPDDAPDDAPAREASGDTDGGQEGPSHHQGCEVPSAYCPCEAGATPVSCDVDTDRTVPPDQPCWLGQRICRDGRWSRCEAWRERFR